MKLKPGGHLTQTERVTRSTMGSTPQIMVGPPESHLDELGPNSSHPKFALRRLDALNSLCTSAAVAIGVVLASAVFLSFRPASVIGGVLGFADWLGAQSHKFVVGAVVTAFCMSALLAGSLQIRASFIRFLTERAGGGRAAGRMVAGAVFVCLAAGLPYVVASYASWRYAFVIDVLALAPLPLIALTLEWLIEEEQGRRTSGWFARLGVAFGVVGLVVAPFAAFQLASGYLRNDLAGWIASFAGSIDLQALLDGGLLKDSAPQWLRDVFDGKYGAEAASLLKSAISSVSSGTDGRRALAQAVQSAIDGPVQQLVRFVSLLLLLPSFAFVMGYARRTSAVIRASIVEKERLERAVDEGADRGAVGGASDDTGASRVGCVGRVLAFLLTPFRGRTQESDPEVSTTAAEEAARLQALVRSMIADLRVDDAAPIEAMQDVSAQDRENPSPPIESSKFDWLFGGVRPTVDQHLALTQFRDCFESYLKQQADAGFGPSGHSHPDFFLESKPGSGATTTLLALAVYSAVVRGQRVLLLKASDRGTEAAVERLRSVLRSVALSDLIAVGKLREGEVQEWTDPQKHQKLEDNPQKIRPIPDILVGTLAEWERICQSGVMDATSMTSALLGVEVVLVDDFGRGQDDCLESMHLPFMLDKHRLFLRSEFRLMQLIVAAPRLDDASRDLLAKRLFGGDGNPRYVRLPPWRSEATSQVEVTAKDGRLDEALKECVRFCTGRGLRTLVYREGASPGWLQNLRSGLKDEQLVSMASEPSQIPEGLRDGFSVVIYRRSIGEAPVLGLAAYADDRPLLFVRVSESAQMARGAIDPIPVLASARSRALFFAHLRSITAYLAKGAPVERNEWVRFGLRERGAMPEFECLPGEQFTRAPRAPMLEFDPPEAEEGIADLAVTEWDRQGIWPSVVVNGQAGAAERRPVDLTRPVEDVTRMYLTADRRLALLGSTDLVADQRRFAVWLAPRGEELASTLDLARADLLRVRFGDRWLRVQEAFSALANRGSRHKIRSDFHSGERGEALIPVFSMSFDIDPHARPIGPLQFGVDGLEWYTFEAARRPLVAKGAIVRLADQFGNESEIGAALEFELDVSISLLVVGMEMPVVQRDEWARACLSGAWTTRGADTAPGREDARGFLPTATAVLQIAFRDLMPDMLTFARILAFRPPRGGRGVVIAIVEPLGTAGTAKETLATVLTRQSLRKRLEEAIGRAVETVRSTKGRVASAPRYEGALAEPSESELRAVFEVTLRLRGQHGSGGLVPRWAPNAVGVIRSPGPADAESWDPQERSATQAGFPPDGTQSLATDANYDWNDHNTVAVQRWRGDQPEVDSSERHVRYGVQFGDFAKIAKDDIAAFGYDVDVLREKSKEGVDARSAYLRSVGFQEDDGGIWADYEWMIERSLDSVRPLAERIVAQADQAGATTRRARISAIHSFVTSLRYEVPGNLDDGRQRWGVRMPTDSLDRRAGDCDSMSVLFLALVRSIGLATGFVVVTHDHALAALQIEVEPHDDYVETADGRLLIVECTQDQYGGRRLGRVQRDLVGVAVRIERPRTRP